MVGHVMFSLSISRPLNKYIQIEVSKYRHHLGHKLGLIQNLEASLLKKKMLFLFENLGIHQLEFYLKWDSSNFFKKIFCYKNDQKFV